MEEVRHATTSRSSVDENRVGRPRDVEHAYLGRRSLSACTPIPFSTLPWQPSPTHPLERKKTWSTGQVAMLELSPGFADPNWCERSHVVLVLSGALELELDGEWVALGAGEACVVDPGTPHRARNPGAEATVVFVISDVSGVRG